MKHRFLKTAMAAFFACTAISVSAANPFADVAEDSWAYQAVAQLSDQGVIDGYPDGTFRGDKNVSRYELAQIIARLMAKEDALNQEQQATVAKLAQEYNQDLANLGVRVAELEKKTGNTELITELRVQSVDRYDNIFTGEKKNEISARVRLNTISRVNDRSTVYGQLETTMGMNGTDPYDVNKLDPKDPEQKKVRSGYGDGELHMNRLWATYHFGKKQDKEKQPFGPSKNLIGIGQFPVKMGVTGYTYDGQFKGAFVSFGDYQQGGRFTVAYGRATDINYAYTGPMMHGVSGLTPLVSGKINSELSNNKDLQNAIAAEKLLSGGTKSNLASIMSNSQAAINASQNIAQIAQSMAKASRDLEDLVKKTPDSEEQLKGLYTKVSATVAAGLKEMNPTKMISDNMHYDLATDTLYPMGTDVVMDWGEDEDVPVAYASYIYKDPGQWEFHAYGMKALGPVGHICKAYGFAGTYNITPMWRVQGEYVKNLRKLPLNNERPQSYNLGLHYGTANVLNAKSFSIGLDYVYSEAGTYFGGSSNDIVDQYMGHMYSNWHGRKMPAYFADKLEDTLNGTTSGKKYGGAKFYLAKAEFVPMKGLIIEADYGFNAKDMGNKKMDNMFMLKATAYIK